VAQRAPSSRRSTWPRALEWDSAGRERAGNPGDDPELDAGAIGRGSATVEHQVDISSLAAYTPDARPAHRWLAAPSSRRQLVPHGRQPGAILVPGHTVGVGSSRRSVPLALTTTAWLSSMNVSRSLGAHRQPRPGWRCQAHDDVPQDHGSTERTGAVQRQCRRSARCSKTTRRRYGSGAPPKPRGSVGSCDRSVQCADPALDRLPRARAISAESRRTIRGERALSARPQRSNQAALSSPNGKRVRTEKPPSGFGPASRLPLRPSTRWPTLCKPKNLVSLACL
jgi:hypothetical protein